MTAPVIPTPPTRNPLLAPGLAFGGGVAVAVLAAFLLRSPTTAMPVASAAPVALAEASPAESSPTEASPTEASPTEPNPTEASLARIEAMVARALEAARHAEAQATRAETLSTQAEATSQRLEGRLEDNQVQRGRQADQTGDRFLAAALLLQTSIATPRPWLREYQAMADLAPAGALPRPLAEVLMSHAARGLPSEAELRERFASLMPQLVARAPQPGGVVDQGLAVLRRGFAMVGLASAPAPSDQELAIGSVAQQMRRGNLAGAVADAASLDAGLQPLLAGWLAQARARIAVEQAVQETLLRALTVPAPNPTPNPAAAAAPSGRAS